MSGSEPNRVAGLHEPSIGAARQARKGAQISDLAGVETEDIPQDGDREALRCLVGQWQSMERNSAVLAAAGHLPVHALGGHRRGNSSDVFAARGVSAG
jgi:hypothetical protein